MGGGGFSMEPGNPILDDFILSLTGKERAAAVHKAQQVEHRVDMAGKSFGRIVPADAPEQPDRAVARVEDQRARIALAGEGTHRAAAIGQRADYDIVSQLAPVLGAHRGVDGSEPA